MRKKIEPSTEHLTIVFLIVLFATLTRIAIPPFLGHPPNFSPLDAIALLSGAYFNQRITACFVVLLSVWVGDIFLNGQLFYSGFYWQYACYVLITLLGTTLKNQIKPLRLGVAALTSSFLFFLVSNFGVWYSGFYPITFDGFLTCYIAAIPFFKNTILSDLFFVGILFMGVELFQYKLKTRAIY
jgi:hypothetical protein